jgi:tetratricopeptide (TPR) repeat protein
MAMDPSETGFVALGTLAHLRRGEVEAAAQDCDRLDAINPESADARGAKGALYLVQGQFDDALHRLRAAAEDDEALWFGLAGAACLLAGQVDEARRIIEKGAAGSPPIWSLLALDELEFVLTRHPARTAVDDVGLATLDIRAVLTEHAGRQAGPAASSAAGATSGSGIATSGSGIGSVAGTDSRSLST